MVVNLSDLDLPLAGIEALLRIVKCNVTEHLNYRSTSTPNINKLDELSFPNTEQFVN